MVSKRALAAAPLFFVLAVGAAAQDSGYTVLAGDTRPVELSGYVNSTSAISSSASASPSIQHLPPASKAVPAVTQRLEQGEPRPMTEEELQVRVVGPKFFPDREEAAVPPTRARPLAQ